MDYTTLARAVEQDAALRRKQILQPVGGKNDKIFPPTYPEERRGQDLKERSGRFWGFLKKVVGKA